MLDPALKWIVIWDALNIHKNHLPRNFVLLYVFSVLILISEHISILVLFFIISVSCFVVPAGFSKIIAWGLWHDFFAPRVGVSHFLCAESGEFAHS